MPSQLETAALRFRSELLRRERAAASEMVQAYGEAWRRVNRQVQELLRQSREAQAAGQEVGLHWLNQYERAVILQRQIEQELRDFSRYAEEMVTAQQRVAVEAANQRAAEMLDLAVEEEGVDPALLGRFVRLPADAVEDLIGFAADGSPLRSLFANLPNGVGQQVLNTLSTGLAVGQNPRTIARAIRRDFGIGLQRALTISRTETLRAAREATSRHYEAHADVLRGWVWITAKDERTCPSCWAMHGTEHPLGTRLESHPNCRCVQAPLVKDAASPVEGETGDSAFQRLPEASQRRILGPAAHEAYKAGKVRLADFVGRRHDDAWGGSRYVKSLRQVLGKEGARPYISKVRSAAQVKVATSPKKSPHYQALQATRLAEVRAMPAAKLHELQQRMSQADQLPKLNEHFRKHGADFGDLGIENAQQMNELFKEHVQRNDLRVFTYVSTQKGTQYRHWVLVGMDNGVVVQYNETQGKFWTMFRKVNANIPHLDNYLNAGQNWWIEVTNWQTRPRAKRW